MNALFLSLHLIAIVSWFAGLFYLPRLFVYHSMTEEKAVFEQLKVMEYKLYYFIMRPALFLTLLTGGVLMLLYTLDPTHVFPAVEVSKASFWQFWLRNWLLWKLGLVALLLLFHWRCGFYLKHLALAQNPDEFKASPHYKTHRFFRVFNEIPTIILIMVIFLAVYKPH